MNSLTTFQQRFLSLSTKQKMYAGFAIVLGILVVIALKEVLCKGIRNRWFEPYNALIGTCYP